MHLLLSKQIIKALLTRKKKSIIDRDIEELNVFLIKVPYPRALS